MRVFELAQLLGITDRKVILLAQDLGIDATTGGSTIEPDDVERIREAHRQGKHLAPPKQAGSIPAPLAGPGGVVRWADRPPTLAEEVRVRSRSDERYDGPALKPLAQWFLDNVILPRRGPTDLRSTRAREAAEANASALQWVTQMFDEKEAIAWLSCFVSPRLNAPQARRFADAGLTPNQVVLPLWDGVFDRRRACLGEQIILGEITPADAVAQVKLYEEERRAS